MSLGAIVAQSSHIMLMRVEQVDREKNLIIYRKVQDLKGKHAQEMIKHNIGRGGLRPNEWKPQMDWAEPGKVAIFFHNGGASETCIGNWWYQAYGGGEWWNHSHGEPFLLRSFAGNPDKLAAAVTAMVAGQEVVVSCMVDGNKEDLHQRRAKMQRLKASLKLLDYNAKRDFVGWGGEDFRRLAGFAGFTHYSALTRVDPEAQAISTVDFDGDGKLDLCLVGAGKVVLLQNGGESLNEVYLPGATGCRSAVWADYNGDGKPDVLLATSNGPKLYTNLGNNAFRNDSQLLPQEPYYTLTAAAWLDQDGDGKPDMLLANGYHGLRLYRNVSPKNQPTAPTAPKLGKWHYLGPFDNTGGKGFVTAHPVEKEIDLKQEFDGKNNEKAVWKAGNFTDGAVNDLRRFQPRNNVWSAVYLYREIDAPEAVDLPVSLGSDDTLTVWLNGVRILAENAYRACAPDQHLVKLQLKQGKNQLLMKICQGDGEYAFYFAAGKIEAPIPQGKWFEDVSTQVGLGPDGIGKGLKGDTLTVCDVNGDGRADFLYGVGNGILALSTPNGFVESKNSGIAYKAGKVGPIFGDFHGDGHPDLFVPMPGGSKLFRNDGKGRFSDVTGKSAALANLKGATCAAWGDVDNDGRLDLVVGCLRGPNRYFRNKGDGTFEDANDALGLGQRIFNTQAVCLADLNNDGVLDMIFNNEGQESCVLMGDPAIANKRTPVTLKIAGPGGVIGSQVRVVDKQGKTHGVQQLSGGDGRGGQHAPHARFALAPGTYRVVVRYSSGIERGREITVASAPLRGVIDEQTPKLE